MIDLYFLFFKLNASVHWQSLIEMLNTFCK